MTDAAPWRAWLAFAAQLGIAPACFWRLSVREWRALAPPASAAHLDRAAFTALAAHFPDDENGR